MTDNYYILSENNQSTVVSCYERPEMACETFYQSEADLERSMAEQIAATLCGTISAKKW